MGAFHKKATSEPFAPCEPVPTSDTCLHIVLRNGKAEACGNPTMTKHTQRCASHVIVGVHLTSSKYRNARQQFNIRF